MTDAEVIAALVGKLGSLQALAERLGESAQTVFNWKERGISWRARPLVQDVAADLRVALPKDFARNKRQVAA